MLMTTSRHRDVVAQLRTELADKDRRIAELEALTARVESHAHLLVEQTRYTLESAAQVLEQQNLARGEAIAKIAHTLPYVFSGRRHCTGSEMADAYASKSAIETASAITRAHGFELPNDPVEAVKSLLELSSMLFVPSYSLPVTGLQIRYPVAVPAY